MKEIKNDQILYQCEECRLKYESPQWAKKCEQWCKEHHTCHVEIIKNAVKDTKIK